MEHITQNVQEIRKELEVYNTMWEDDLSYLEKTGIHIDETK